MDEKAVVFTFAKQTPFYYKYVLQDKEVLGNIYIAKDIIETAPEKIQIVIRENKE